MRARHLIGVLAAMIAAGACRAEDETVADGQVAAAWSIAASVTTYLVHRGLDYVQPTIATDHDWLHLEGRYNYEDLKTGSLWMGYNWSVGDEVRLELTPIVGGVFGELNGVAPGYELTLGYRKLELYSEGEYVFTTTPAADDFLYNWSSLTFAPVDWGHLGMVTQRTRIHDTGRAIQRGPLVGLSYRGLDLAAYVLDPDATTWTLAFSLGVSF